VTDHGSTPIKAVPLRRPGRWISAGILVTLLFLFAWGAATNDAYDWPTYGKYLFDERISAAALVTLQLTVIAMLIAVVLGVLLAVMRLSDNPVLRALSWLYIWFFRGTPVYVQLVFWGLITSIYHQVHIGIPWGPSLLTFDVREVGSAFLFAFIGLGLNEAAYMAEIVRAGIRSVDEGQTEAAQALGMSWPQTMRRIVLPQAMRVIIPPTGNEVISMLKTTSLVIAVPFTGDLYGRARDISGVNFEPVPLLLVASTWYLLITSILMIGQFYLERYYSKGASRKLTNRQLQALADAQGGKPSITPRSSNGGAM
jgi:polar amino acid transport system permease protein